MWEYVVYEGPLQAKFLNKRGYENWELIAILPIDNPPGKERKYLLVCKRPRRTTIWQWFKNRVILRDHPTYLEKTAP